MAVWGKSRDWANSLNPSGQANFSPGFFGADAPQVAMVGAPVEWEGDRSGQHECLQSSSHEPWVRMRAATSTITTHVASMGAAQQREAEVMLVLDEVRVHVGFTHCRSQNCGQSRF